MKKLLILIPILMIITSCVTQIIEPDLQVETGSFSDESKCYYDVDKWIITFPPCKDMSLILVRHPNPAIGWMEIDEMINTPFKPIYYPEIGEIHIWEPEKSLYCCEYRIVIGY